MTALPIAYHEAGHAVVGWAVGYRTTCIRLTSKGKFDGWCDYGRPSHALRSAILAARRICPEVDIFLEILVSLAGAAAEGLIAPGAAFDDYDRLTIADILQADLGCQSEDDAIRIMRPLVAICANLVEMHRDRIAALAALLADRKVVRQADVRKILGRRTMPPRDVVFEVLASLEQTELDAGTTASL